MRRMELEETPNSHGEQHDGPYYLWTKPCRKKTIYSTRGVNRLRLVKTWKIKEQVVCGAWSFSMFFHTLSIYFPFKQVFSWRYPISVLPISCVGFHVLMFHVLFVAPARNDAALETDREEDLHWRSSKVTVATWSVTLDLLCTASPSQRLKTAENHRNNPKHVMWWKSLL